MSCHCLSVANALNLCTYLAIKRTWYTDRHTGGKASLPISTQTESQTHTNSKDKKINRKTARQQKDRQIYKQWTGRQIEEERWVNFLPYILATIITISTGCTEKPDRKKIVPSFQL